MDRICPFCQTQMTWWARGRCALRLCVGAGALDEWWEVWRCSGARTRRLSRCHAYLEAASVHTTVALCAGQRRSPLERRHLSLWSGQTQYTCGLLACVTTNLTTPAATTAALSSPASTSIMYAHGFVAVTDHALHPVAVLGLVPACLDVQARTAMGANRTARTVADRICASEVWLRANLQAVSREK